ncbi:MAG TPA: hypothetical protein VGW38_24175 [Chloroflexota bacterium]|nr:hypothetical protein [Chloroflexota bacterium]
MKNSHATKRHWRWGRLPSSLLLAGAALSVSLVGALSPATPAKAQQIPTSFPETGFRVDDAAVRAYFDARGGIDTFGYPVSRTFTFLGFPTQVFQRHLIQVGGAGPGSVAPMNLLDPDLMPVTSVNFSTFPAHDPTVAASAPAPGTPNYGQAVVAYLQAVVPDVWEGQQVNFLQSYISGAPADAGGLRPLVALEVWGFPTSLPARDPNNHNFVYQRFQRGIMHFDAATGVTRGILLADTFKSVLTGENLPVDVLAQMAGSPYLRAYEPAQPNGVAFGRPLGNTNLTSAFVTQTGEAIAPPVAPPPAAPALPTAPAYQEGFAYGMQAHLYYQDVPSALGLVQNAGFGWVKQQVRWSAVEIELGRYDWAPLDQIVVNAASRGVKVLFSVVTAPSWSRSAGGVDGPPDDYVLFGNFLSELASRYQGRVQAYEVWNEQNFSREWGGGRLNAGEYVELLKVAYPAIKAADPAAVVISGAPTPTGFNDPAVAIDDVLYLQQMYAYQGGILRTVSDAIGAHAGGFNNPPDDWTDVQTDPSTNFKGHPSFYFRRIEQLRDVMVANGDAGKKMWLTEFGWSTYNLAPGYEYGADNTEQEQAAFLVRAFEIGRNYGWVDGMFVWNLNFQQMVPATDEKFPFGIVRPDGTPRPAYTALQWMPKWP